ncbi:MAG: putative cell survival pathways protein [Claussenomyces sp. TS43310]|nr:MAG: putative cell survival pathways protein [Claussenomyces sp. TS43310]
MEFITPPSYASTCVNVGGIAKDGEIMFAGATNTIKYIESKEDQETLWPEPILAEYIWEGKSKDGHVSAKLSGPLGDRRDRIDILSHIPGIIKSLAGGVVGIRPYVYQFSSPPPEIPLLSQSRTATLRP